MLRFSQRCPYCLGADTRPSRRHGLERALVLLLIRPYRCHGCFRRFLRVTPVQWGGLTPAVARPPRPA
jgi:hypothetical protein